MVGNNLTFKLFALGVFSECFFCFLKITRILKRVTCLKYQEGLKRTGKQEIVS